MRCGCEWSALEFFTNCPKCSWPIVMKREDVSSRTSVRDEEEDCPCDEP